MQVGTLVALRAALPLLVAKMQRGPIELKVVNGEPRLYFLLWDRPDWTYEVLRMQAGGGWASSMGNAAAAAAFNAWYPHAEGIGRQLIRMMCIKEELMQAVWAPTRVEKWLAADERLEGV